ncbi:DUF4760 domain-containing protein [Aquibium carbonis]|uniref:DUF4760 domain-containing protein n=1 Tax=Aquibium carbonis TaxID=2495581 RepID=UPI001FE1E02E|nr:hypothetical protein [Aquibium carbonis]
MSAAPGKVAATATRLAERTEAFPEVEDVEKRENNPFTDGDWRMLSYAWSGFALRILLVLGTIFSVYQYMQAREEKRIERTLELVELWDQPEYQAAQRSLKRRLTELNARFSADLGRSTTPKELAIFQERIGIEAMKAEGGTMSSDEFLESFDRIVYFLNRVSFCVDGGLCSKDVAEAYFRDFAQSFWGYFAGHIRQERRRGSPNLAKPLEDYVSAAR